MYTIDNDMGLNGYDDDGLNAGLNWRFRMPKIAVGSFIKRNVQSAGRDATKFAKENIRIKNVNLKNAITAASIAAMFVPGGQALGVGLKLSKAASLAAKLSKLGKIGRLATKAIKLSQSPLFKGAVQAVKIGRQLTRQQAEAVAQVAVANDIDPTTPNVLTPQEFSTIAGAIAPTAVQAQAPLMKDVATPLVQNAPTRAQVQTLAEVKGIDTEVVNTPTKGQMETISNIKDIPVENIKEEVKNQLEDTSKGTANTDQSLDAGKPEDKPKSGMSPLVIGVGVLAVGGLIYAVSK